MSETRTEFRVCSASGKTLSTYHDGMKGDVLEAADRMAAFLDTPNQVSNDKPHRVERRTVTTTEWVPLLPRDQRREIADAYVDGLMDEIRGDES